jgi:hypothetical protein
MTTVEQWVVESRAEQGLPPHVEELTILTDLARLVLKSREERDDDG